MSASLVQLDRVLARIEDLVALGRDRFDSDDPVRLAAERLWIYAGNLSLDHCRAKQGQLTGGGSTGRFWSPTNLLNKRLGGQPGTVAMWPFVAS